MIRNDTTKTGSSARVPVTFCVYFATRLYYRNRNSDHISVTASFSFRVSLVESDPQDINHECLCRDFKAHFRESLLICPHSAQQTQRSPIDLCIYVTYKTHSTVRLRTLVGKRSHRAITLNLPKPTVNTSKYKEENICSLPWLSWSTSVGLAEERVLLNHY